MYSFFFSLKFWLFSNLDPYFLFTDKVVCPSSDIGFLLDYSTTIDQNNFERSKTAIKMLVKDFKVRVGGSRASLITFSTDADYRMPFGKYKTASEFNAAVNGIKREGNFLLSHLVLQSLCFYKSVYSLCLRWQNIY